MIYTAGQFLAHLVGDYCLQSDWQANMKTKAWWPAIVHAFLYTLPFMLITQRPSALICIMGSHIIIDHYRLARYAGWLKNFLGARATVTFTPDPNGTWHEEGHDCPLTEGPEAGKTLPLYTCPPGSNHRARRDETRWWHPWADCVGTGYHKDKPPFLALWLMFITDNTFHLIINGLAITYLRW